MELRQEAISLQQGFLYEVLRRLAIAYELAGQVQQACAMASDEPFKGPQIPACASPTRSASRVVGRCTSASICP